MHFGWVGVGGGLCVVSVSDHENEMPRSCTENDQPSFDWNTQLDVPTSKSTYTAAIPTGISVGLVSSIPDPSSMHDVILITRSRATGSTVAVEVGGGKRWIRNALGQVYVHVFLVRACKKRLSSSRG